MELPSKGVDVVEDQAAALVCVWCEEGKRQQRDRRLGMLNETALSLHTHTID